MKEMTLEEVQKATKELLVEFDNICNEIGIRYFLMYGSLLGAIRHKGFIPWDDDLDVGMFESDYLKLCNYFKANNNLELELHNQDSTEHCFFNIARVCEKKHRLVFDNKKYTSGLFIDIYVMEGLGDTEDQLYWNQRFKKHSGWRKGVYVNSNEGFLYGNGVLHKILNIPFCLFARKRGKQYYINKFNSHKKYDINDSKFIGCPSWEESRYERKWFDSIISTEFEDIEVLIPAAFDEILTSEYGDYMKLPPIENRKPYHGYRAYRKNE